MPRVLIGDGYDFAFTSQPTTRTAGPVTIQYRPPVYRDLVAYDRATYGTPAEQSDGLLTLLADHVGSWDAVDADDKPIKPTKENLAKVRDWLLLKQFADAIAKSSTDLATDQKK